MSAFKKLQTVRAKLHATKLEKTGSNNGKAFFELGDFMPQAIVLMNEIGLCGVCSFTPDLATLVIHDTDNESATPVIVTAPMGTADLKGCHNVQNIGASITYERRYLWMTALDIIEHDGLDTSSMGGLDITDHLTAIHDAASLEQLQKAFTAAIQTASQARDKNAQLEIIAAKDAKKASLQKVAA